MKRTLLVQPGSHSARHGIQSVTDDPSFVAKPARTAKLKGGAQSNGHDGALPEPEWSKDIRAYYEAVVEEPVPQEFVDLLAQIAKDITE